MIDFFRIFFKNKIIEYEKKIKELTEEIKKLKNETNYFEKPTIYPNFLEKTENVYKGSFQFVSRDGKVFNMTPNDIREFYSLFDFEIEFAKKLTNKTKVEKLKEIWKYVVEAGTYAYDYVDAWYLPIQTITKKQFDCEDGTILFVSICRACRISPYEVFNAIGDTDFGYHSYPIVYLTQNEAKEYGVEKEGWYIFETTLDFLPQKPKALIGSKYYVDDIQNWAFYGRIKKEFLGEFNMAKNTKSNENKKVENNEEKIKKINEYWRGG